MKLVAAAEAQIAGDGQKPSRDALGVGARVPHVLEGGVVGADDGDRACLASFEDARADPALFGVDLVGDVDHGVGLLPSWVA